jgi:hypothetical protein
MMRRIFVICSVSPIISSYQYWFLQILHSLIRQSAPEGNEWSNWLHFLITISINISGSGGLSENRVGSAGRLWKVGGARVHNLSICDCRWVRENNCMQSLVCFALLLLCKKWRRWRQSHQSQEMAPESTFSVINAFFSPTILWAPYFLWLLLNAFKIQILSDTTNLGDQGISDFIDVFLPDCLPKILCTERKSLAKRRPRSESIITALIEEGVSITIATSTIETEDKRISRTVPQFNRSAYSPQLVHIK